MFYIFHGEDTHSQHETLEKLKAKLGDAEMLSLNTTRLNGKGLTVGNLQDACNAMPFLSPKRLVIVEDYFAGKPAKKEVDALLEYLPQMPDTARLVFLESKTLSSRSRALKLADKDDKGYAKQFDRPSGGRLERWIVDHTAELGGEMHPRAAHMLATNVGNDLTLLSHEIEKLVLYKGIREEPETITNRDVKLLSPYAAEVNIFDLVDALGARNGRRAAELLHQKLEEGAEPFIIFSMFIRQFRLLIQVKELAEDNMNPAAIAKTLKQHPFVIKKVHQQAHSFSMEQLEQVYAHLLEIDVKIKTGQTDIITALHMLVFILAA